MKYVNFCLAAILSLALSSGSVKSDLPSIGYHPGEMFPDIILTDSEGERLALHELKGKKVVLNFWASYDAQSRASNVKLYNFLSGNNTDVTFISVSFDENPNVLERTLAMDHLEKISCYRETNGAGSELYRNFSFKKGFRSYLIDEQGVITAMNIDPNDLRTFL